MVAIPENLRAAYHAALYEVDPPQGAPIRFQAGVPSTDLDALLDAKQCSQAVLVTACNPRSVALCAAENAAAQENLRNELAACAHAFLPGRGLDPTGAWPSEPSFLVLGLDRAAGAALAQAYGQYAFVYLMRGRAPEIVPAG